MALFKQRALFRHLRTLRVCPCPSDNIRAEFDAFGSALAALPSLTALSLDLALQPNVLSSFAWRLPSLRRLRIGHDCYADQRLLADVPMIVAPRLELFEASALHLSRD